MSTTQAHPDTALDRDCPVIDGRRQIQRLAARISDVGGIPVARLLPQRDRRLIGAWCFLDHAGPARFAPGEPGLHVGPHPHTSLQTFTWMIAGTVMHRDSLGYEQIIRPGQVNLMTAGYGISHTEDSPEGERDLHAAQLWIALPHAYRDVPPRFDHYPELPRFRLGGLDATLLIGRYADHEAPTLSYSLLLGMDLVWSSAAAQRVTLDPAFEYGILPLEGALRIDGERIETDELAYLGISRAETEIETLGTGRALLIGGAPLEEEITIWWNFVGHSRTAIEQAQRDWNARDARFGDVTNAQGRRLEPPPIPWARGDHP